jgi:hypothetical protein
MLGASSKSGHLDDHTRIIYITFHNNMSSNRSSLPFPRSNGSPTPEYSAVAGISKSSTSSPHTRPSQTPELAQRGSRNPRLSCLAMCFGAAARDRSIRQWESYRHATSWAYPSPLPYCCCHDTIDRSQMMDKYHMPIFFMLS